MLRRPRTYSGGARSVILVAMRSRAVWQALRLAVIIVGQLWCAGCRRHSPSPDSCGYKGGRVERDLTLRAACSPYEIRGGIDVLENATLTLEPGVEMRFFSTDWLEISAAGTHGGRLVARGTAAQPIVLTSVDAKAGWLGVWLNAGTRDSVLSHVVIRNAGGSNKFLPPPLVVGCVTVTRAADAAIRIEDVVLEHCRNAGVVLERSRPALARLRIADAPAGFLLYDVEPQHVPSDVTYEGVAETIVQRRSSP
jgi:hypothetical protein